MFRKIISGFLSFCLVATIPVPIAYGQNLLLPPVGEMVHLSAPFVPVLLKGMTVHPENPLQFDFIVDNGQTQLANVDLEAESQKLIKYFLTSMTIPKNDLWVNLSPNEPNRIITAELAKTELGRNLLEQDYILKQLTATLMNPEEKLGAEFWSKIKKEVDTNIPTNTFNKVWILPESATVYEYENTVYIVNSHLKVMLDQDYQSSADKQTPETEMIRQVILPAIEKEVNEGQNFAPLRQIYHSLILAKWYKDTVKNSLLSKVYIDKNKTGGVDEVDEKTKDQIYEQYMSAYKKGVYNFLKEEYDPATQTVIPRQYFSGGFQDAAMIMIPTADVALVGNARVGDQSQISIELRSAKDNAMLFAIEGLKFSDIKPTDILLTDFPESEWDDIVIRLINAGLSRQQQAKLEIRPFETVQQALQLRMDNNDFKMDQQKLENAGSLSRTRFSVDDMKTPTDKLLFWRTMASFLGISFYREWQKTLEIQNESNNSHERLLKLFNLIELNSDLKVKIADDLNSLASLLKKRADDIDATSSFNDYVEREISKLIQPLMESLNSGQPAPQKIYEDLSGGIKTLFRQINHRKEINKEILHVTNDIIQKIETETDKEDPDSAMLLPGSDPSKFNHVERSLTLNGENGLKTKQLEFTTYLTISWPSHIYSFDWNHKTQKIRVRKIGANKPATDIESNTFSVAGILDANFLPKFDGEDVSFVTTIKANNATDQLIQVDWLESLTPDEKAQFEHLYQTLTSPQAKVRPTPIDRVIISWNTEEHGFNIKSPNGYIAPAYVEAAAALANLKFMRRPRKNEDTAMLNGLSPTTNIAQISAAAVGGQLRLSTSPNPVAPPEALVAVKELTSQLAVELPAENITTLRLYMGNFNKTKGAHLLHALSNLASATLKGENYISKKTAIEIEDFLENNVFRFEGSSLELTYQSTLALLKRIIRKDQAMLTDQQQATVRLYALSKQSELFPNDKERLYATGFAAYWGDELAQKLISYIATGESKIGNSFQKSFISQALQKSNYPPRVAEQMFTFSDFLTIDNLAAMLANPTSDISVLNLIRFDYQLHHRLIPIMSAQLIAESDELVELIASWNDNPAIDFDKRQQLEEERDRQSQLIDEMLQHDDLFLKQTLRLEVNKIYRFVKQLEDQFKQHQLNRQQLDEALKEYTQIKSSFDVGISTIERQIQTYKNARKAIADILKESDTTILTERDIIRQAFALEKGQQKEKDGWRDELQFAVAVAAHLGDKPSQDLIVRLATPEKTPQEAPEFSDQLINQIFGHSSDLFKEITSLKSPKNTHLPELTGDSQEHRSAIQLFRLDQAEKAKRFRIQRSELWGEIFAEEAEQILASIKNSISRLSTQKQKNRNEKLDQITQKFTDRLKVFTEEKRAHIAAALKVADKAKKEVVAVHLNDVEQTMNNKNLMLQLYIRELRRLEQNMFPDTAMLGDPLDQKQLQAIALSKSFPANDLLYQFAFAAYLGDELAQKLISYETRGESKTGNGFDPILIQEIVKSSKYPPLDIPEVLKNAPPLAIASKDSIIELMLFNFGLRNALSKTMIDKLIAESTKATELGTQKENDPTIPPEKRQRLDTVILHIRSIAAQFLDDPDFMMKTIQAEINKAHLLIQKSKQEDQPQVEENLKQYKEILKGWDVGIRTLEQQLQFFREAQETITDILKTDTAMLNSGEQSQISIELKSAKDNAMLLFAIEGLKFSDIKPTDILLTDFPESEWDDIIIRLIKAGLSRQQQAKLEIRPFETVQQALQLRMDNNDFKMDQQKLENAGPLSRTRFSVDDIKTPTDKLLFWRTMSSFLGISIYTEWQKTLAIQNESNNSHERLLKLFNLIELNSDLSLEIADDLDNLASLLKKRADDIDATSSFNDYVDREISKLLKPLMEFLNSGQPAPQKLYEDLSGGIKTLFRQINPRKEINKEILYTTNSIIQKIESTTDKDDTDTAMLSGYLPSVFTAAVTKPDISLIEAAIRNPVITITIIGATVGIWSFVRSQEKRAALQRIAELPSQLRSPYESDVEKAVNELEEIKRSWPTQFSEIIRNLLIDNVRPYLQATGQLEHIQSLYNYGQQIITDDVIEQFYAALKDYKIIGAKYFPKDKSFHFVPGNVFSAYREGIISGWDAQRKTIRLKTSTAVRVRSGERWYTFQPTLRGIRQSSLFPGGGSETTQLATMTITIKDELAISFNESAEKNNLAPIYDVTITALNTNQRTDYLDIIWSEPFAPNLLPEVDQIVSDVLQNLPLSKTVFDAAKNQFSVHRNGGKLYKIFSPQRQPAPTYLIAAVNEINDELKRRQNDGAMLGGYLPDQAMITDESFINQLKRLKNARSDHQKIAALVKKYASQQIENKRTIPQEIRQRIRDELNKRPDVTKHIDLVSLSILDVDFWKTLQAIEKSSPEEKAARLPQLTECLNPNVVIMWDGPTRDLRIIDVMTAMRASADDFTQKPLKTVASYLKHPHAMVRAQAIRTLGRFGAKQYKSKFHEMERMELFKTVRKAIQAALKNLDHAQLSKVGGIDMNNINLKREGRGPTIEFDQKVIEGITEDIQGFVPVIINITPLPSVLPLLGLKLTRYEKEISKI